MRRLPLLLLAFLAACQSRGQLVLGLATDLSAQGQLDHVRLRVTRRGDTSTVVDKTWLLSGVPAQDFRLPGSFNLYADKGQQPVFDVVIDGILAGVQKVERHAALGIVKGTDRFMRLTLVASCEETGCPGSLACVEGQCVAVQINPLRLPNYSGGLVTSLQCASSTSFTDTSTRLAMPLVGSCETDEVCSEGTCLLTRAPGGDTVPFTGAAADVFGFGSTTTSPGVFVPVGALDAPRYFASATQLGDGRVLVLGGLPTFAADGSGTPVGGAVIYDASLAAFRRIIDPPAALAGHTATLLQDGTVLIVGASHGVPYAFTFDPTTETFTTRTAPSVPRAFHTATLLQNGQVFFVGGLSGTTIQPSAERYDPTTQSFSTVPSAPLLARYFHAATLLANGDVLVSGGLVTTSSGPTPTAATERYVAASQTFAETASMTRPRAMHTATALSDGSVLTVGGFVELPGAAHGDAETLLGTNPHELDVAPPFAAGLQQAIPLGADRILFVGGASTLDPDPSAQPTGGAYLWNGTSFIALPAPKTARVAGFAAPIPETVRADQTPDVLIGGGVQSPSDNTDGGVDMTSDDMSMPCDPVASKGCPDDTTQKCTIAGVTTFGPGLFTDGPRCVGNPTSPVELNGPCMSTDQDSSLDDGCTRGTVCMTDTSDETGHCQKLCNTDVDCVADGTRTRCALIVATGGNTTAYGVCQLPCTYPDVNEFCSQNQADMGVHSLSCHYAPNVAKPGGGIETQGFCRFDGDLTYESTQSSASCTQADEADACAYGFQCVAGRCLSMCIVNDPDDSEICQNTCTLLVSTDTQSQYGVCDQRPL